MQTRMEELFGDARHAVRTSEVSAFMWATYRWMSLGLALTGLVAFFTAQSPALLNAIFGNRALLFGLLIAEVGLVVVFSRIAERARSTTAAAMFLGYSALNGLTLASIFIIYTQASIAQVFFVSAG